MEIRTMTELLISACSHRINAGSGISEAAALDVVRGKLCEVLHDLDTSEAKQKRIAVLVRERRALRAAFSEGREKFHEQDSKIRQEILDLERTKQ